MENRYEINWDKYAKTARMAGAEGAILLWLCVVFTVRKIWKGKNDYGELSRKVRLKFSMIPLLTVTSMLLMFFYNSMEAKV